MKQVSYVIVLFFGFASLAISGLPGSTIVMEQMPDNQTLKSGQVVYVENDGRCSPGLVIKITGGNKIKGITRQIECVLRPN